MTWTKCNLQLKAYQEKNVEDVAPLLESAVLPTLPPQPPQEIQMLQSVTIPPPQLFPQHHPETKSVDVIVEMLISEKNQITNELAHFKTLAKQKELELEELQVRYNMKVKHSEELENTFAQEQRGKDELQSLHANMSREVEQLRSQNAEHLDYINELKNCLAAEKQRLTELETKKSESVLEEIRANHFSENAADSRVEALIQTKFMYEQQIRDLQAIVQQMTQDKEQSHQQYQTFGAHLNQEILSLNEKNAELTENCSKLEAREKSLVDHVSSLEKQIQHNLKLQLQADNKNEENQKLVEEITKLKSQIDEMNEEKMIFQMKIKSQEEKLEAISREQSAPKEEIVERVYSPEEDKKLLEKMESDKIAASRALIQNADLKQQLDELQMKFIELTNDKVDLMTKLDSEMFSNKQYHALKADVECLNEKLHFKDEEMIRLSHENNDLKLENMELKHGKRQESRAADLSEHNHESDECSGHHKEPHVHEPNDHCKESDDHSHELSHNNHETKEEDTNSHSTIKLPPEAAMQKLEQRFTKLMSEVADLTDDKQRLEHLVLQLQGETETIGEYITLYQTQRRVLKQRDYERNNYLQKIECERQEVLRKMDNMNKLLSSLGIKVPVDGGGDTSVIEPEPPIVNGYEDKQQVLQKIQSIIHEMQEKSIIKDDLTKCGSGGNIAIDHCSFCSGTLETV